MSAGLSVAFFGSSLVSAHGNGAATYYRGLIRALHARGHRVTFYEPDALERQRYRALALPPWARVVVYPATEDAARAAVQSAVTADVVVKASGVGVFDAALEDAVAAFRSPRRTTVLWDADAPGTLERLAQDPHDRLRALVPVFDVVLTCGGGAPVQAVYRGLGARRCIPICNALDPATHHPVAADARFECDLALLANRLRDRESRIDSFFLAPAAALPGRSFLLGGSGWHARALPANVRYVGHVFATDHSAMNATALAVLNVTRDSMARAGYSPPTYLFEAAGAGACLITDAWTGIEQFLEPGREVLVARDGGEVAASVSQLTRERARAIGEAARARLLGEHTYAHRAELVEAVLEGRDLARWDLAS